MEDAELLARAARGDEGAFELVVRRHTDAAWRLARSLIPDDFAAEEAVQDTFMKAYRGMGNFRGESAVKTWILTICHRVCLDHLRLKRHPVVPLDDLKRERAARRDQVEMRDALTEAVRTLGDEERRAFTLVDILGYSREEASVIAGVPSSTMRSRVSRARERLALQMSRVPLEEHA
ncbi:MAG: sigma-70 family RNA polymerase sigma factor [Candidatus Dormibacteria bacterium]